MDGSILPIDNEGKLDSTKVEDLGKPIDNGMKTKSLRVELQVASGLIKANV